MKNRSNESKKKCWRRTDAPFGGTSIEVNRVLKGGYLYNHYMSETTEMYTDEICPNLIKELSLMDDMGDEMWRWDEDSFEGLDCLYVIYDRQDVPEPIAWGVLQDVNSDEMEGTSPHGCIGRLVVSKELVEPVRDDAFYFLLSVMLEDCETFKLTHCIVPLSEKDFKLRLAYRFCGFKHLSKIVDLYIEDKPFRGDVFVKYLNPVEALTGEVDI